MNDRLREKCELNGFGFISSCNISRIHLWKNGVHLEDLRSNILAGILGIFWTGLFYPNILNRLYTDKHLNGLYANIGDLISGNSLSPPEAISEIVVAKL